MSEKSEKSSFRSLLEMSDKIAREELGDYYVMGASRMRNMLDCLEDGAKRIQKLTAKNAVLEQAICRIADTPDDYEMEYCRQIAISALEEVI